MKTYKHTLAITWKKNSNRSIMRNEIVASKLSSSERPIIVISRAVVINLDSGGKIWRHLSQDDHFPWRHPKGKGSYQLGFFFQAFSHFLCFLSNLSLFVFVAILYFVCLFVLSFLFFSVSLSLLLSIHVYIHLSIFVCLPTLPLYLTSFSRSLFLSDSQFH